MTIVAYDYPKRMSYTFNTLYNIMYYKYTHQSGRYVQHEHTHIVPMVFRSVISDYAR